tara:strand:- start:1185 stop:2426 length:1242 start_codon:yes stop_codon:yes gene_type:complete
MSLKIFAADDSNKFYQTNIEFESNIEYEVYHRYRHRYRSESGSSIYPSAYRHTHDPTTAAISKWLINKLHLNEKGIGDFHTYVKVGSEKDPFTMMLSKIGTRYHLMGEMQSKDTIITAMSRVIFKSCFDSNTENLYCYMLHHLRLPENVSYALENRAPFHWYVKGQKIDVRFNVKMIDDDECALEISDGVWAPITVKSFNVYMNYYWKQIQRGSWAFLSPKRLWSKLMKKEPTEAQLNMMIAFLQQNRTDDIVQDRAIQLVKDLEKQYVGRMKVLWFSPGESNKKEIKAILVRGKLADWVITDNQFKSNIQAVSTYIFKKGTKGTLESYKGRIIIQDGYLDGPICIDNMTKNSSVGDQFAARALALLNDTITVKIVNTIQRYLNEQHLEGQIHQRIDMDMFCHKDVKSVINDD